jgi:hypothetical protein
MVLDFTCSLLLILLAWFVYLLLLPVLPFLLLLLNCVFVCAFLTDPLVLFGYYLVYLHFKLTVLRYVSPYSYFLDYLWSGTRVLVPQPLVKWKSCSAPCYSTTSYAPTTLVSVEPLKLRSLFLLLVYLDVLDTFPCVLSNTALYFTLSLLPDPNVAIQ